MCLRQLMFCLMVLSSRCEGDSITLSHDAVVFVWKHGASCLLHTWSSCCPSMHWEMAWRGGWVWTIWFRGNHTCFCVHEWQFKALIRLQCSIWHHILWKWRQLAGKLWWCLLFSFQMTLVWTGVRRGINLRASTFYWLKEICNMSTSTSFAPQIVSHRWRWWNLLQRASNPWKRRFWSVWCLQQCKCIGCSTTASGHMWQSTCIRAFEPSWQRC